MFGHELVVSCLVGEMLELVSELDTPRLLIRAYLAQITWDGMKNSSYFTNVKTHEHKLVLKIGHLACG